MEEMGLSKPTVSIERLGPGSAPGCGKILPRPSNPLLLGTSNA